MTANPPFRTIQLQRDTAANWTSANTLLAEGELGLEMDTRKAKIGDGVTNWNSLSYAFSSVGGDMLKSENLSGLADYNTARSNLGLGSLATQSGTFSDKEDTANKSTTLDTDKASNTKFPSVKSVYDWAVALFAPLFGYATSGVDGATVTFNLATNKSHQVTIAGNRTLALSNTTNIPVFSINIKQDGTGSRTVTWFSGITWAGGTTPTLTTTANKTDSFGFQQISAGVYLGFIIGQNI